MAAKRTKDEMQLEQEEGYISDITNVKISRNNNKYFNGKLQTEFQTYNFVCYTPEKHSEYQSAEKMGSPIKLTNIKYSPSYIDKNSLDIQISRRSSMQVVKKLDFRKRKVQKPAVPVGDDHASRTLTDINSVDRTTSHVMVSIMCISTIIEPVSLVM